MLLRNNDELEVVSREKKDRRDFDQLSALATRMGLHRYFQLHCFRLNTVFIFTSAHISYDVY